MAAGTTKIDIAGLEGNEAAQPRVFAHAANAITLPASAADAFVYTYPTPPADTAVVMSRGACIYVGGAGDIDVELESGDRVIFKGVTAGSFLPILATKIYGYNSVPAQTTTATDIIALF
jgi:hypothetical protein